MPLFRVQSQSLRAREIPRRGDGGRQFKNEAGGEGGFSRCFSGGSV